jgi:four helix bundle protein
MRNFKHLQIWERSHSLTLHIYGHTKSFPKEEQYGLTSQMRRSAASIPTNIAEGSGRDSDPELKRFLVIAMGSASELEYQLLLSKELEYLDAQTYDILNSELIEIRRMLNSFIQKIKSRIKISKTYLTKT